MVDSEFRARVLQAVRLNATGQMDGITLRGIRTVLCANANEKPMRVEEALEELIDKGALTYDGEKLRLPEHDR